MSRDDQGGQDKHGSDRMFEIGRSVFFFFPLPCVVPDLLGPQGISKLGRGKKVSQTKSVVQSGIQ
jgi:hypothetical protein